MYRLIFTFDNIKYEYGFEYVFIRMLIYSLFDVYGLYVSDLLPAPVERGFQRVNPSLRTGRFAGP